MSDLWNFKQETLPTATWLRSWRQELFTDYNTDFTIVCHMEQITCDSNHNKISSTLLDPISRKISDVGLDPDVQLINQALTRLIKKWRDEDVAAKVTPINPTE